MPKNSEISKNKLIWTLIIFSGIITIFAYIIINNGGLALKKNNFTAMINESKEKIKGKSIDTTKDSEDNKELEKIREEVKKSKQATVEREKAETEEIKKETIKANGKEFQQQSPTTNGVSLAKVQEELGEAYSQVETPDEQQIITAMRTAVSRLEDDPNYDSTTDKNSVKASYSKLDEVSKNRLKFAIFTSVDGESITQLRKTFGL